MSDHSHRAERVRPTTVRMAELAERLQLRRMGSSGDGARRLEAAVSRVVQARAARPAHGDPELSAVPSAEGRPQAGTRLGELLVREGTISGGQRDAALCRQAGSPRLLGEILVEAEMLTAESLARCLRQQCGGPPSAAAILPRVGLPPEYLAACLQRQRRSGEALSDIIRDLNLLSDEAIAKVVAIEHGLSYLPHTEVDHLPVESVRTAHIASRDYRGYVPIAIAHGGTPPRLSVALSDVRTMQQAVQDFKSYQCHFHVATRATCATIHQRFFAGTLEQ